jgi:hypothetical protein
MKHDDCNQDLFSARKATGKERNISEDDTK